MSIKKVHSKKDVSCFNVKRLNNTSSSFSAQTLSWNNNNDLKRNTVTFSVNSEGSQNKTGIKQKNVS